MMTLVIGGASSGKSAVAEDIVMAIPGAKTYVATMMPFGEQAKARVQRHLALREGKGMATIEQYTDLAAIADRAAAYDVLLIECMTNLVANEQFAPNAAPDTDIAQKVYNDIQTLQAVCPNLVIVTCDVFGDGIIYPQETMDYMRHLGRLNQMLAASAARVTDVFYGLATERKGGSYEAD